MWFDGWVAIDTETTGFSSTARVLELGVVTFERGAPVREWSQLLCPAGVDWDSREVQGALQVNGLTRGELEGKPTFEDVLPQLLLELSHEVWVAHNADFDVRMLSQEMNRLGVPVKKPKVLACTKNLGSRFNRTGQGNKLADVASRYGVKQDGAHRATVDAKTSGLILAAMRKEGQLPDDEVQLVQMLEGAGRAWDSRNRRR